MTKSTITRERVVALMAEHSYDSALVDALEHLLAAMDSEPHTDDELSNLLWYSQEATCHSDPNYYCEFQRLATPGFIVGIIRELQERRKADSEPVAEITEDLGRLFVKISYPTTLRAGDKLYRHARQPVVPDEKDKAVDADDHPLLWSFNEGWNACRAAMLNGGKS